MDNDFNPETEDIFGEDTFVDPNKDYYEDLVGEGKKYADNKALARSKVEGDAFIKRLQAEQAAIRAELAKRTTVEEFMDKMNQRQSPDTTNHVVERTSENTAPDVRELVSQELEKRTQEFQKKQNADHCADELRKAWGEEYQIQARAKAKALGVSVEYLGRVAETQPNVFLALMLPQTNAPTFKTPQGSQLDTSKSYNTGDDKKTLSWYKKQYPNAADYWTPSVQNEIHKQALKLGADFFDT